MIQYLNRLKAKKGFTLVELIIVIALIAVLITVLLVNMIGGNTDKVLSANSNAKAFFTAAQLTVSRAQLTERSIVNYADTDTKYIEYKNGANTTNGKYLFIEARFSQNGVEGIHISNTLNALMALDEPSSTMTVLEQYIAQNLDEYMAESYDGYFYAAVDDNFKVFFTHYCSERLPRYNGSLTDFRDDLMISNGKLVGNERIIGSCSDAYILPATGEYAFAIPASDYDLYLA